MAGFLTSRGFVTPRAKPQCAVSPRRRNRRALGLCRVDHMARCRLSVVQVCRCAGQGLALGLVSGRFSVPPLPEAMRGTRRCRSPVFRNKLGLLSGFRTSGDTHMCSLALGADGVLDLLGDCRDGVLRGGGIVS